MNNIHLLQDALNLKYKDQDFSVGETVESFKWSDPSKPRLSVTQAQIAIDEYIAWRNLNGYKERRQKAYPRVEDLVVAIIENAEGRPEMLNAVKALRAEVKIRFPKPE